ncbi:MAG: diapophytoene dehydrogenase [Flavobacteriales bacterium]|nr:diapophytoene dehydrogenase [Flavobacteriales bacterium]|tara:strand:+ start:14103 stop:15470 length:1368 start_codon:yes stop_codon:yes gene_type:complete
MAKVNIIMPKMGESVAEATIIKWVKNTGDSIEVDETIVEIATDKVDSEIPSITKGILLEKLYQEDDVVKVGEIIAVIDDGSNDTVNVNDSLKETQKNETQSDTINHQTSELEKNAKHAKKLQEQDSQLNNLTTQKTDTHNTENIFFSPLVKSIAKKENISQLELEKISGTGKNGRVTKNDILNYVENKRTTKPIQNIDKNSIDDQNRLTKSQSINPLKYKNAEMVEMDRMRILIAKHMIDSKATSAHVTSFAEADVSKIVEWRNRVKNKFFERENQKITYTPIIFESVIKAIQDFPLINISVDGNYIVKHKNIHLGMATALPTGNLIVPVIKNSQEKNILGLTNSVNDLAKRARENKLQPDEISGGTFTITNVGSFGSVMGTPIINQPQVAILALGKIQKKPTVIETEFGDTIGIRSKMFLSLSYDHRVVDGALGGQFLQRICHYMESFDTSKEI